MHYWPYKYNNDRLFGTNGTVLHFKEGDKVWLATAEQVLTYPASIRRWYREHVPTQYLGVCTNISKKVEPDFHTDGYYELDCFPPEENLCFYDQDLAPFKNPPKPLSQEDTLPNI